MCGISGYVEYGRNAKREYIEEMVKMLRHRGPDDSGIEEFSLFYENRYINGMLGFDRLSIRDLSLLGHQPMKSSDGNVILAFNGEIYNSDQFREELKREGYIFQSKTDTEVILNLYLKYGLRGMLDRLNGMFAICLVDKIQDRIYLARDRAGEKPLYYYQNKDTFLFASEEKAFYLHPNFTPELNEERLDEYFMFSYIAGNETLLRDVYIVRPGCYLEVSMHNISEHSYWSMPRSRNSQNNDPLLFQKALEKSVASRMVSDVPVGVELSGGIDSSLVSYFAKKKQKEVAAYSIVFDNPDYSEETYIDYAADKIEITVQKYRFSVTNFIDEIKKCTWHFDAPVNHQGSVALYHLCKKINRKTPVILTGEGADELLGGYEWYHSTFFQRNTPVVNRLKRWKHNLTKQKGCSWADLDKLTENELHTLATSVFKPDVLFGLRAHADIKKAVAARVEILEAVEQTGIIRRLEYEMKTYMVDLLLRQDKMSMAASIECRVPFVDQNLTEYVRTNIGEECLIKKCSKNSRSRNSKIILKKVAAKVFGEEFTYREKMGLPLPLKEFYETKEFGDYFTEEIYPGIEKRGAVNADFVWSLWENKTERNVKILWSVINFEIWAQIFIDHQGAGVRKYGSEISR